MTSGTTPWNAAEHVIDHESIAAYLDVVREGGDPELLKAALGDVAHSIGMTEIAKATGLSRTSLFKTLSQDGNPEFATIVKVLPTLGLGIGVTSAA